MQNIYTSHARPNDFPRSQKSHAQSKQSQHSHGTNNNSLSLTRKSCSIAASNSTTHWLASRASTTLSTSRNSGFDTGGCCYTSIGISGISSVSSISVVVVVVVAVGSRCVGWWARGIKNSCRRQSLDRLFMASVTCSLIVYAGEGGIKTGRKRHTRTMVQGQSVMVRVVASVTV